MSEGEVRGDEVRGERGEVRGDEVRGERGKERVPLRLRAPVLVVGDADLAHRVLLHAIPVH